MKYYSLCDLKKKGVSDLDINNIISNVLEITLSIKSDYPDYKNWFLTKHVPNLFIDRDILIAVYKNEIVGVANLKISEKKICTLYIKQCFRKNQIGTNLIKKSYEILETNTPLITISNENILKYRKIILDNNWILTNNISNLYKDNVNEYVFNNLNVIEDVDVDSDIIKILSKHNIIKIFNNSLDFYIYFINFKYSKKVNEFNH